MPPNSAIVGQRCFFLGPGLDGPGPILPAVLLLQCTTAFLWLDSQPESLPPYPQRQIYVVQAERKRGLGTTYRELTERSTQKPRSLRPWTSAELHTKLLACAMPSLIWRLVINTCIWEPKAGLGEKAETIASTQISQIPATVASLGLRDAPHPDFTAGAVFSAPPAPKKRLESRSWQGRMLRRPSHCSAPKPKGKQESRWSSIPSSVQCPKSALASHVPNPSHLSQRANQVWPHPPQRKRAKWEIRRLLQHYGHKLLVPRSVGIWTPPAS